MKPRYRKDDIVQRDCGCVVMMIADSNEADARDETNSILIDSPCGDWGVALGLECNTFMDTHFLLYRAPKRAPRKKARP